MKLSTHFDLAEFVRSDVAARRGIDNSLPPELLVTVQVTANWLEGVRARLCQLAGRDVALQISSGYRCLALNRAIGSTDSSDHVRGMAVDFVAPGFGSPLQVCQALATEVTGLSIGQLIYEHTWVHLSRRMPDKALNRILTVQGSGYVVGLPT